MAVSVAARASSGVFTGSSTAVLKPMARSASKLRSFCIAVTMPAGPVDEVARSACTLAASVSPTESRTCTATRAASATSGTASAAASFERIVSLLVTSDSRPIGPVPGDSYRPFRAAHAPHRARDQAPAPRAASLSCRTQPPSSSALKRKSGLQSGLHRVQQPGSMRTKSGSGASSARSRRTRPIAERPSSPAVSSSRR